MEKQIIVGNKNINVLYSIPSSPELLKSVLLKCKPSGMSFKNFFSLVLSIYNRTTNKETVRHRYQGGKKKE